MKNEDIKEGLILRNSWNEFCDSLKEAATIIKSEVKNLDGCVEKKFIIST